MHRLNNPGLILALAIPLLAGLAAALVMVLPGQTAESAPQSQRPALADALVTDSEYAAAVERVATCLEAAGVKAERHPGEGKLLPSVGFASASSVQADLDHATFDACKQEHLGSVAAARMEQDRPDAALQAEARAFVGRCMAEAGVPVPAEVTDAVISGWLFEPRDDAAQLAIWKCIDRRKVEFGT